MGNKLWPRLLRRQFCVLLAMTFMLIPAASASELTPGEPAHIESQGTAARKLQRGFLNIALAPFELSHDFATVKHEEWWIPSWLVASVTGVGKTAGRAVVGIYEIATFWTPYPSNYGPIVKPEFAWEYYRSG